MTGLKTREAQMKKSIQASLLGEGERVILTGQVHGGIYWKAVAALILGLLLLIPAFNLGVFILFVGAVMFVYAHLTRAYLVLMLTNKHVAVRSGIAFMDITQIRHSQIESVNVAATLIGQMFGYATVVIAGTGQRVIMIPFIANARQFRQELDKMLVAREEKLGG